MKNIHLVGLALLALPAPILRAQSKQETEAFFAAVKAGDRAKTEFAVRRTAALLQCTQAGGMTGLHQAAADGNLEVTRVLVERGAKLEAKTKGEHTPAQEDRVEYVSGEKTPLQVTTDPKVAAYLLAKGARLPKVGVTCAGDETWSLRMWAPARTSPEVLAGALKAGADPNEHCTANHGTCCDPTAFRYVDQPAFLQAFLNGGLDPNLPSYKDATATEGSRRPTNTLLLEASRQGKVDSVRLLLAKGAKVETADAHGATPLTVAKTPEIAALLKAAGAK